MFPPKAGRVCSKYPSLVISKSVQSAVNPTLIRAATRGAKSLPILVAPINNMLGLY